MAVRASASPTTWPMKGGDRQPNHGVGRWACPLDVATASLDGSRSWTLPWVLELGERQLDSLDASFVEGSGSLGISVPSLARGSEGVIAKLPNTRVLEIRCIDLDGISATQKILASVRDARLAVGTGASRVSVGWTPTSGEADDIAQLRVLSQLLAQLESAAERRTQFEIHCDLTLEAAGRAFDSLGGLVAWLGSQLIGPALAEVSTIYLPDSDGLGSCPERLDPGYVTAFARQFLDLHSGQRTLDGGSGSRYAMLSDLLHRHGLTIRDWLTAPTESLLLPVHLTG